MTLEEIRRSEKLFLTAGRQVNDNDNKKTAP